MRPAPLPRALALDRLPVSLVEFITRCREEVIARWAHKVARRLGLSATERPRLINDLPGFLDEVVECLSLPPEDWNKHESAQAHGRHRVETGVDIGALAEEFGMVAETVIELCGEHGIAIDAREVATLMRLIARGTAASVREYARLRDLQIARESSRHFSFVAHELRTPLQTARIAVLLLEQERGGPDAHLERLSRAHTQLADLIDNSLVEARLLGEPILHCESHSTAELMRQAVESAQLAAWRKGIAIEASGADLPFFVDRKLILSALTNLVVNGVKFSRENGRVTLRCVDRPDRLLFEVSDECGGIPDDVLPRLFQPFVQAGRDRSGFGLGLMIVKQAVESHGGAVRATNVDGGCCFVVELPHTQPTIG